MKEVASDSEWSDGAESQDEFARIKKRSRRLNLCSRRTLSCGFRKG
jgi:hypothetical protein